MLSSIPAPVPQKGNKVEAENMNPDHGQTFYDKASSSIAHLALSMQKQIVICKAILTTRLLQQRYSMLSSITAPVPHKVNKEEENMNAHHGQTLYDKASSSIDHLSHTEHKQIVI